MDKNKSLFLFVILSTTAAAIRYYDVPSEHVERDWNAAAQQELRDALNVKLNTNVAKNVILFLGDGMGLTSVWASRVYTGQYKYGQSGEEFQFSFEKFPHIALSKTYNVDAQIPDSAATATAFMSGVKANYATVGVNQKVMRSNCSNAAENHVQSILDWSMDAGKATGIVTSTRITHATPAAAYAHTPERYWENDAEMLIERYGITPEDNAPFNCTDIAAQLVDDNPNINVILGGGRRSFRPESVADEEYPDMFYKRQDGRDLISDWLGEKESRDARHEFVWNKQQFDAVDPATTDYLLGLFEPAHMQYEHYRNQTQEPSLADLTRKAIQILQRDDDGFFLLVEGGRIDHAHHENQARLALDETWAFDEAIKVAQQLTSIEDTLIVVTADHSHSFTTTGYPTRGSDILGLVDNEYLAPPLDNLPHSTLAYANGPGGPGGVAYNEPRANLTDTDTTSAEYHFQSLVNMDDETHGGEDVPIYASGPMAHLFHHVHEQNYIAHVMGYASCVGENMDHCRSTDDTNTANSVGSFSIMVISSVIILLKCFM